MSHSTMGVPSVGSDNGMHILSPPASNERVESSMYGSTIMPSAAQQTAMIAFGSQLANGTHDFNSLNIIYPTPPTPMQQFSPQNAVINAHLLAEAQQQRLHDAQQPSTSGGAGLKFDLSEDTQICAVSY